MSGTTTTQRTDPRPRRWRFVALASSLTLALAGLVGLGLAPAASAAEVAAQCPDGYTLVEGTNTCTKTVDPIATPGEWVCPDGFTPASTPVGETTKCLKQTGTTWQYAKATQGATTYSCTEYGGTLNGSKCEMPAEPDGYTCPSGQTYLTHDVPQAGCYAVTQCTRTSDDDSADVAHQTCWAYQGPGALDYDCERNWSNPDNSATCSRDAKQVPGEWSCQSGWTKYWGTCEIPGAAGIACDDNCYMCKIQKPVYEEAGTTQLPTTYRCPEGSSPPNDARSAELICLATIDAFCSAGTGPVDGICTTPDVVPAVVPGGPTPVTDFCPNLEGVQWENYDCSTPQEVAAEVVAPEVITPVPAPATVAAPEAATVAAPAPAAVSAGVAGTAAAPAAATVPAAIPAGDGSQAPTVPIWALAMIVVGVLGMAVAGRKLVTTK